MKNYLRFLIASVMFFISLVGTAAAVSAEVKTEEQVVGPLAEMYNGRNPYVVSPRGVHLAR